MVSQRLFDGLPPFPENVPTADVPKFSLAKLSSGDASYASKLFETCRRTGFFLLEMGGEETGDNIIKEIDAMFDISNSIFDLDIEEKRKYAQEASKGRFTGYWIPTCIDSHNKRDVAREGIANRYIDGRMSANRSWRVGRRTAASSTHLSKTTSSATCLLSRILMPSSPTARSSRPSLPTLTASSPKSCPCWTPAWDYSVGLWHRW